VVAQDCIKQNAQRFVQIRRSGYQHGIGKRTLADFGCIVIAWAVHKTYRLCSIKPFYAD
jgi:hypothetical protein